MNLWTTPPPRLNSIKEKTALFLRDGFPNIVLRSWDLVKGRGSIISTNFIIFPLFFKSCSIFILDMLYLCLSCICLQYLYLLSCICLQSMSSSPVKTRPPRAAAAHIILLDIRYQHYAISLFIYIYHPPSYIYQILTVCDVMICIIITIG